MQLPDVTTLDIYSADQINGSYPEQVNPSLAYSLTSLFLDNNGGGKYLIGTDMLSSSHELLGGVISAVSLKNIQFLFMPKAAFSLFQFAVRSGAYQGGIWVGASRGSRELSGIRFLDSQAKAPDHTQFREQIERGVYKIETAIPRIDISSLPQEDQAFKEYFFATLKAVDPLHWKRQKLVIDGGNGLGGELLKNLLGKMPQVETVFINSEPDEHFPHHFPNPLIPANNSYLSKLVVEEKADLGVSLDQDGDAFILIGPDGNQIATAVTAALLTEIVLKRKPRARIGHDYLQIYAVEQAINENGGQNVPFRSSYKDIKQAAVELDLELAISSRGEYYYNELQYAASPFYSLILILDYLSNNNLRLPQAVEKYLSNFAHSGELTFLLHENVRWEQVKNNFCDLFQEAVPVEHDDLLLEDEHFRISVKPYRTAFIKVYIEAMSDLLLQELQQRLMEKAGNFSVYTRGMTECLDIEMLLKSDRDKFEALLKNLWFTWNPHFILPIIDMYGDGWRKNVPPEALVANYGRDRLNQIFSEKQWELCQNSRIFKDYLNNEKNFQLNYEKDPKFSVLRTNPIAYFCMEFGLADWLQIYSGGLGVLAGDYMKQASDMGVPVVGIGIFYHQGYLHQDFSPEGAQLEHYIHQDPMDFNMELVKDKDGKTIVISLPMDGHEVKIRAWRQKIGINELLLLDTNFEENDEWEDRLITGYLYGGDIENRIRQEIVLGIAGARLLHEMGIRPAIYHMNEGHSGFLVIEMVRAIMLEQQLGFEEALNQAEQKLVFTNHTLKQAGNDIFEFPLFEKYLNPFAEDIKTDINTLFALGDDKAYAKGGFSMTIFGLRHAKVSNAVSKLHAKAAQTIWPDHKLVPVTNGVHMPTWVSPEIHRLLDQYLGERWHDAVENLDYSKIQKIPHQQLWRAHKIRKQKLIHSLNNELGLQLSPDYLTIAWSRRLAAYKRPDLLITDIERLKAIVGNSTRPVQILIAGKSHPKDTIGKQILQKMNNSFNDSFFHNRIEIIPGYNWQLARRMVSGADIWLNTPYRYEEASGTSGMKAAANGLIQFTTLDGWTDEVDWFRIGWVIAEQDSANSLYGILENNITPLFYDQNSFGYNDDWVAMMLNSMQLSLERFSAERMLKDYLETVYRQIL